MKRNKYKIRNTRNINIAPIKIVSINAHISATHISSGFSNSYLRT
jgi:hypothetical protein